jgi:hypothetical protein
MAATSLRRERANERRSAVLADELNAGLFSSVRADADLIAVGHFPTHSGQVSIGTFGSAWGCVCMNGLPLETGIYSCAHRHTTFKSLKTLQYLTHHQQN